MAIPTALEIPCPSGPVVASTPGVSAGLRMTGAKAVNLPEPLQVLQRQVVAGQVEQAVKHRAGVAGRKDEPVAVRPVADWPGCASGAGPRSGTPPATAPSGIPGCPDFAAWTMSSASIRKVVMQRRSSSFVRHPHLLPFHAASDARRRFRAASAREGRLRAPLVLSPDSLVGIPVTIPKARRQIECRACLKSFLKTALTRAGAKG